MGRFEKFFSQYYPKINPEWDSWSLNYQSSEQLKRINQVLHNDSQRQQLIEFLEKKKSLLCNSLPIKKDRR